MQRHIWLFLLFVIGGFIGLHAQSAHLTVYVSDAETGERLPAATIIVGSEGKVADVTGKASWELDPGQYIVESRYIGYQALRDTFFCMAGERTEKYYALLPTQLLLEAATVTSSRSTRSLAEATVSLDIIKPDFIKRNNAVSLDAVLDRIPGVQILDGQPNIRGGSGYSYGAGSRVMLLLDDVPILQADAGFPNWRDLPIENAGQIEVLKGAASTLYGSAALNGIINMKTDYARSEPETEALLFTTVQGQPADEEKAWWGKGNPPITYGGHFIHRRKWKKWDLSAGAYHINRESHYENAGNIFSRAYAHTRYRINDRLVASLGAILNTGESQSYFYWRSAGALEGAPAAFSSGSFTRFYLDPRLNYFDKTGAQHRFLGRIMTVDNKNNNDQGITSGSYYGEYQYQKEFDDNRWSISAGLVGISSWTDSPLFSNTRIDQSNLASYVQLEAKPIEGLSLTGGARYEYNRITTPDVIGEDTIDLSKLKEGRPIFRLGANYRTGKATYWRASWGEGYRFPTIAEKFISTNAGVLPVTANPLLESETGWTAEVGVKQGVLLGGIQGFFDMSLFWSQYNNMMEFTLVFDGQGFSFQSLNVGETRIRGGEISFTGQGNIGAVSGQVLVGYTYLDPQFLDFDLSGKNIPINDRANATEGQINAANSSVDYNILKYRSVHQFKSDISLGWEGLTIGWAIRQASHVKAVDNIFEVALPGVKQYRELNDQGYWVHDFRVGYKFRAHQLTFLTQNANNEDYTVRPGILEAPRSYTLQYLIRI